MKKNLLADLELDVHELAYLLETLAVTPDQKLKNVAKRNILRIREQLDSLYEELDSELEKVPEEEPAVVYNPSVEEEDPQSHKEEIPEAAHSISIEEEEATDEEEAEVQECLPDKETDIEDIEKLPKEEKEVKLPAKSLKEDIKEHWQQKYFTEEKKSNIPLKQIISLSDSFYFSRILFNGETGKLLGLLEELEEIGTADEAIGNYFGSISGPQNEEDQEAFIDLGARIYGWFRDKEK